MKLVKVWWDYDDERFSQQAFLLEEGNPDDVIYKNTGDGFEECQEEFFEFVSHKGLVIFKEVQNNDIFGINASTIVKIEVLEE